MNGINRFSFKHSRVESLLFECINGHLRCLLRIDEKEMTSIGAQEVWLSLYKARGTTDRHNGSLWGRNAKSWLEGHLHRNFL
jgi:hypothetical protein